MKKTKERTETKKKEIIENIQLMAKELGRSPFRREYLEKFPNPQFEKFGGFSKMLEEAGLIKNRHINLTNEEIKNLFIEYIKKNGIPISHRFPKTLPSYDTICFRFGSYKKFLNSIGYDTLEKTYTKEEIINILKNGIDEGEIKSIIDLNKSKFPSRLTVYKMLGVKNWKETLTLIERNLESNYKKGSKCNYTKTELKQMYLTLSKKLNKKRGASKYDVRKFLGINQDVFCRVFRKSFVELRQEWGFQQTNRKKIYSKEELKKILKEKVKEKGRNLTAREIIADKDMPSISTFYRTFNTTSIKKIYTEID